jgi:ABC-type nitrate/sulfonate/bicarbonate transport system substrate-binding protein
MAGLLTTPVLADHGDKPIQINAGSPGWDHSFPFIAEKMGFWKKYGLKVNFLQGSFSRNRQMMSIADYDAGFISREGFRSGSSPRPPLVRPP